MSKIVKARYEKGVLRLLEPIELREGEEVRIRIEENIRERLKDIIGVPRRIQRGGAREVS